MPIFMPAPSASLLRLFTFDGRPAGGIQILTERVLFELIYASWFVRGNKRIALERALHVLRGLRVGGHGVHLLLQSFLNCWLETGELNAHAHSAITRPDNGWSGNRFRAQPERDG